MNKIYNSFITLSIRYKILLIVTVSSGAAIILTFGIFILLNSSQLRTNMEEELEVLGRVIGNRSVEALVYYDKKVADENLRAFRAKRSIVIACIYDEDGETFSKYIRESSENIYCPENPQNSDIFNNEDINLFRDIFIAEDKIGSLYIRSDVKAIHNSLILYLIYALVSIMAGAIIAYVISSRMLKIILDPISSLLSTAKLVMDNYDYSIRAKKSTNDELGILVDAVNNMLNQIQQRDKKIIDSYESMEERVINRTKQLEEATKFAEGANKAKSLFLANMSHELRTPMHAILSYADFGIDEIDDANKSDILKYFSRIHVSGERLLALLNNLLDLSKMEAGKVVFNIREDDLQKPIRLVVKELQKLLEEKKLSVCVVKPEFETIAFFDADKIVQVLYNLLSNAIKFSHEGKKITISFDKAVLSLSDTDDNSEFISVSVVDEGIGIPENEYQSVFDKFIQSSKTKTGAGGTGLGLAICHEIIKGHNGKIWCRNNIGGGAVFTFTLPCVTKSDKEERK